MSMKSRGNGKAKKTVSKVISNPLDKMSVGQASSKGAIPGFKKGGSVTRADGCIAKGHTKGKSV